jgi:hypothetical protein
VQGAFWITRALAADAGEVDQPRVIGRGLQERRERGSSISQPAGCEMRDDEFCAQCLFLEDCYTRDRCGAGTRNYVVGRAGVRGACAKEGSIKAG